MGTNRHPGLLAVTMGDPAGIGPEIVARALAAADSGRCVVGPWAGLFLERFELRFEGDDALVVVEEAGTA